jgi:hypothetical protein
VLQPPWQLRQTLFRTFSFSLTAVSTALTFATSPPFEKVVAVKETHGAYQKVIRLAIDPVGAL